jgi:acyl-phosphate glycerol 3-phosphate acyltransferase
MSALFALLALLVSYVIGALPLGSRLIKMWTGQSASSLSAHNLGVENVLRLAGAPVALASFGLDILKGFAALALFSGHPLALVGVYLGHLYPIGLFKRGEVLRGRGNGVILGILAGLWAFAGVPWLVTALPLAVYAALLGWTGFVSLATLAGLASLPLSLWLSGQDSALALGTLALFGLALWRHKANLARILDQTEPRLGDPPPVRGVDPGVVYAAFMVHPMTLDDLWQVGSSRMMAFLNRQGWLPERVVRQALFWLRPLKHAELKGIRLSDGRELRVVLITGPMLPDQIRAYPELATRMAIQGARLGYELGAEAFGLGAFWSTVGNKGLEVQEAVPEIHITNGGAYTAATVKAAVPGLLERFKQEGGSLERACAAVVGANGVVAFGVARLIAGDVGKLIMIGRDLERLERSAETLRRKFKRTEIVCSVAMEDCTEADLIFTATSDPDPVIYPEHVKPGAWLFDLGRPADVDERVREVPGVHVIPGGVVRPPGEMQSLVDIHFGDKMVPACMAETMIMTATRAFERKSLGPMTRTKDIEFYLQAGEALGFEVVTRDLRVADPLRA